MTASGTTPFQAFPVPLETDNPDVALDMTNLAKAIEKRVVGVYATASARNTAVTSPVDGMFSYLQDTNLVQVYQDGAWVTFPPQQVAVTSGTSVPSNSSGNNGDVFFKTS